MVSGKITSVLRNYVADEDAKPSKSSFKGFLRAVAGGDHVVLAKQYGSNRVQEPRATVSKGAMSESSGTAGGYLVPKDYSTALLRSLAEESWFYKLATVIPMLSRETDCPIVDSTTTPSAGNSPFFGSATFSWGSEQTPAETEPTFRNVNLTAWDLIGYSKVSNQFLMDSGPEGELALIKLLGKAAAWYAEFAMIQGAGSAKSMPLGILNSPATIATGPNNGGRTTNGQIVQADIAWLGGSMLPSGWKNAVWACSPTAMEYIAKSAGFTTDRPASDRFEGAAGTLLWRPLFVTEKLPALGTKGDLVFFDPTMYVVGMRQEILIDVSPHALFATNQTMLRIWLRMDGKPMLNNTVTLQDASTVVSPMVVLN